MNEKSDFFIYHFENIESYVTLALAKNNQNFISNLMLDFPHIKNKALELFNAWSFNNDETLNKKWSSLNTFNFRKIINAREQYCN